MSTATQNAIHDLREQNEAARVLLATYEDILGEDEQAKADMVEGETDLHEAIRRGLVRLAEIEALQEGITAFQNRLKARAHRLGEQEKNLRSAILLAMEIASLKRLETDVATVTCKATPPGLVLISEAEIPAQFWRRAEPTLDRRALIAALKEAKEAGEAIPGATLDNGGLTLMVSTR